MAEYKLIMTVPALEDIHDISEYITCTLKNPSAAQKFSDKIFSSVSSLSLLPKRYRVRKRKYKGYDVCYMLSGKFVIMYCVNDVNFTVSVIRVIYSGRNLDALI